MNFVDEQHVAIAELGEDADEVGPLGQRRAVGHVDLRPDLVGHDMRQRRLPQPRRPVQQHVIDRLLAPAGRLDGDAEACESAIPARCTAQSAAAESAKLSRSSGSPPESEETMRSRGIQTV